MPKKIRKKPPGVSSSPPSSASPRSTQSHQFIDPPRADWCQTSWKTITPPSGLDRSGHESHPGGRRELLDPRQLAGDQLVELAGTGLDLGALRGEHLAHPLGGQAVAVVDEGVERRQPRIELRAALAAGEDVVAHLRRRVVELALQGVQADRKSTRLNSSH